MTDAIPKTIWTLWLQGWDQAPELARACLASWRRLNPDWTVRALDERAVENFLSQSDRYWIFAAKKPDEALSDQIRIALLREHGGVWADATTMCARPLDDWLPAHQTSGFFAFERPGPKRMLASWFLAAAIDNYVVRRWREDCIEFWKDRTDRGDYFWFHQLFEAAYATNSAFKSLWDSTPKLTADHLLHFKPGVNADRLPLPITAEYEAALRTPPHPVFKLTRKFEGEPAANSLIERLIAFGYGHLKP